MVLVAVLLVWWLKYYAKLDNLLVWQGGKEYLLNYWRLTKKQHFLPEILAPLEPLIPALILILVVFGLLGFFRSALVKLVLTSIWLLFTLQISNDQQELEKSDADKDVSDPALKNCSFEHKDKFFTKLLTVRFRQWAVPLFWLSVLDIWGGMMVWWLQQDYILCYQDKSKASTSYKLVLNKWLSWLEFIPLRLWALGYALVGDFIPAFSYITKHLKTFTSAETLLEQSGCLAISVNPKTLAACQAKPIDAKGKKQLQQAAELHHRTVGLSLGLVVLASLVAMFVG